MRRLGEKLAILQSRLMADNNHPVHKISSKESSVRRKSAFTLPCKEPGIVSDTKRHSLQLLPTLKDRTRGAERSSERTANLMPELNEIHDATYPQELNPATSLLNSVSMHSRTLSRHNIQSLSLHRPAQDPVQDPDLKKNNQMN